MKRVATILFALLALQSLYSHGWLYFEKVSVDLPSFHTAAKLAFADRVVPYDPPAFAATAERLGQPVMPFLYPPTALLVMFPLALVGYAMAVRLTMLANHVLSWVAVYLLAFRVLRLRADEPVTSLVIATVLLFYPLHLTYESGQVNVLMLVLICFAWTAIRDGAPSWRVGLPLALATAIKLFPGLLIVYLALRRRYRDVAWCAGFLALFALVSVVVLPSGTWQTWVGDVLPTGGYGRMIGGSVNPVSAWNLSLNGFTARLFRSGYTQPLIDAPELARSVPYFLTAALLAVTGWSVARRPRSGDGDTGDPDAVERELGLVLLAALVVTPLSWEHHLVMALPAILLVMTQVARGERATAPSIVLGGACVVLALHYNLVWLWRDGLATLLVSGKLFAVLALWAGLMTGAVRRASPRLAPSAAELPSARA